MRAVDERGTQLPIQEEYVAEPLVRLRFTDALGLLRCGHES
jgi:hypothetical protein